jgi:hypothetical protein
MIWLYIISVGVLVFTALVVIGGAVVVVMVAQRMRQTWELLYYPQTPNLPTLPDATELFRDDGQRIEVGTKRDRVVDMLLVWCLFSARCAIAIVLIRRQPHPSPRYVPGCQCWRSSSCC